MTAITRKKKENRIPTPSYIIQRSWWPRQKGKYLYLVDEIHRLPSAHLPFAHVSQSHMNLTVPSLGAFMNVPLVI